MRFSWICCVDLFGGALPQRAFVGQPGVVHQHVDRSGLVLHTVHQPVPLLAVEQVGRVSRAAELGSQGLERGSVARHEGDGGSRAGEGGGQERPMPLDAPVISTLLPASCMAPLLLSALRTY